MPPDPRAASILSAGLPEPLGVTLGDGGVNVAVYSAHASSIDFCLFEDESESRRFRLPAGTPLPSAAVMVARLLSIEYPD